MNNIFSIPILVEKLSKLNNSQQSIESLSLWCIVHRKRAKHVVETWGKLFNSSQKEQRVSFLYLANDILQNSRRKGSEFVNEFWKVLPGSLKLVYENGDDQGKNVVMRLVGIWNERNVFGSRGQGLKDDILAKGPPCLLDNIGMNSNPIKVVKKDAHTIRIKLSVGGMPEKIVTAYQSLGDEHFDEDTFLNKCRDVVGDVGKMEIDVNNACTRGIQQGSSLMGEIQEQETILNQCIEQLESVEASRTALVARLREALKEQEPKLELIHSQLQVARAEKEHIISMKQRLTSSTPVNNPNPNLDPPITTSEDSEQATELKPPPLLPSPPNPSTLAPPQSSHSLANALSYPLPPSSLNPLNAPPPSPPVISFINSLTPIPPPQPPQHLTSFANCSSSEEENKKAAAAVAARLASSTSSAQMLTSVLSSLAAEEAATMNSGGLSSSAFSTIFSPEKRRKLENPYYGHGSFPPLPQMSPANQPPPPPFPRPPPLPPAVQQFVGVGPFSFGSNGLPPPPLMSMGLPQSSPLPPPPPLPPPHQQQHSTASGYYEPPRIGFYGKLQMGTPQPPLPPQGSIASQGSST